MAEYYPIVSEDHSLSRLLARIPPSQKMRCAGGKQCDDQGRAIAGLLRKIAPALIMSAQKCPKQDRSRSIPGFTLVEVIVALLISAIFTSVTMQALVTSAAFRVKAAQYDESFNWIQDDLEAVVTQANLYAMDVVPYSADCGATNPASGVASHFITDALGGSTTALGTREFAGKTFILERTANVATSDPMRLVELTYTVTEQGTSNEVSTITSEVIPQAVLRCP